MKAVVESIGGVASAVRIGGHELHFDQPASVPGGEDRGPSPLDVMVVAVAACAHYFAAAYLHGHRLTTAGLTVEAEWEKERIPTPRVGRIVMKVHVPPGLTAEQITRVERAIRNCPAYGTLLHPPAVEIQVAVEATGSVALTG
jgi:putative redox protein